MVFTITPLATLNPFIYIYFFRNIQIFFVYNNKRTEVDNALEGILYFYPEWVSDDQKSALCGQIIGTIHCMKNLFSKPDIISLHNGKFLVIESRTLYFVLGTDTNVPSTFLKYLAKNLYDSLKFFYQDVQSLEIISETTTLMQKLHDIFDGYLKMLNFSGQLHSQTSLPKSSNDIFNEAMQILECCRNIEHVLGGIIIYRNRLIATQICTLLTQLLLLMGTGSVKCPSIGNNLPFDLPPEVQLYEVFISNKEYSTLIKDGQKNNFFQLLGSGSIKKKTPKSTQTNNDNSLLTAMKREQSLIFTSVPEEEPSANFKQAPAYSTKRNRPRFLNLDSAIPKSNKFKGLKQISALPHSSSQIIVCNTPLQEQKKIVHFNPLLICNNEALDDKKYANHILPSEITLNRWRPRKCTTNSFVPFERKSACYRTLADPTFPIFKLDGKLMSVYLYREKYSQDPQFRRSCEDLESVYLSKEEITGHGKHFRSSIKIPMLPSIPISSNFFNCKIKANKCNKKMDLKKANFDFHYKKSKKKSDLNETVSSQKCHLFLWQYQDIALSLLLKPETFEVKQTFAVLEDLCVKNLTKLECKMRNNIHLQNSQDKELNKFVILNSCTSFRSEDVLWNGTGDEWRKFNYFNQDLSDPNLNEVLIRCDENVFYSYQCGPTKIFYSEVSTCNGGLPLPTDPLGLLQVKAKRRLERDCAFILL